MSKYIPGDKVTVRPDLMHGVKYYMDDGGVSWCAIDEMVKAMAGKTATIVSARTKSDGGGYRIEEFECIWTDEMFSGYSPEMFPPEELGEVSSEDYLGLFN